MSVQDVVSAVCKREKETGFLAMFAVNDLGKGMGGGRRLGLVRTPVWCLQLTAHLIA